MEKSVDNGKVNALKCLGGKKKSDKGINQLREYITHSPVIQILPYRKSS